MDRAIAEAVTAAALIVIGRRLTYWEIETKKVDLTIQDAKKKVDFFAGEIAKVERNSMVHRALQESSKNLQKARDGLRPLSLVRRMTDPGMPEEERRRSA